MAKITLRHTKNLSDLELKRALGALKQPDPTQNLRERVRQLQQFEKKFGISSVTFYRKYRAGNMGDVESPPHSAPPRPH